MSTTDPQQTVPDSSTSPTEASPSQPVTDQETISVNRSEYDTMQEQLAQARATFEALNPHASRIERLVRNSRAGELFDNAWTAWEQMQAASGPQVSEEVRPLYDEVKRIGKYVDEFEQTRKAELERPQREFQSHYSEWQNSPANNRFFQRLMADHTDLRPRDIQYLAQVAAENNFEPLESVWKKESWRFERQATAAPPTSQRADAGEVGSAPSSNGQGGPSMRERIIELERARRGMTA